MNIDTIIKRNYSKTSFQPEKITNAILKAMISVNNGELEDAERITLKVNEDLISRKDSISNYIPNVEEIQDLEWLQNIQIETRVESNKVGIVRISNKANGSWMRINSDTT